MKNKGFTLVEVLVAMLCSTFVVAGIALILRFAFNNYKDIRLESELQIEAQTLGNKLETLLKSAESYSWSNETGVLKIKGHKIENNKIVTKYYYLILDNRKSYLVTSDVEVENPTFTDSNYLSNFIKDLDITPSELNTYNESELKELKLSTDGEIIINIAEEEGKVFYDKIIRFKPRQGE